MDSPPPPIALEYAAPPVFYQASYRTRSRYTIATAALAGTVSLTAIAGSVLTAGRVDAGTRQVMAALGGATLAVAGWGGWQCWRDATHVVRVTGDGIEAAGRFWPWARVRRVDALAVSGGVSLQFAPHRGIASRANAALMAVPPMRRAAYDVLRVELDHHFRTRGYAVETGDVRFA